MAANLTFAPQQNLTEGCVVTFLFQRLGGPDLHKIKIIHPSNKEEVLDLVNIDCNKDDVRVPWHTAKLDGGRYEIKALDQNNRQLAEAKLDLGLRAFVTEQAVPVTMRRTSTPLLDDLALWVVIRANAEFLSFDNYKKWIDLVLCGVPMPPNWLDPDIQKYTNLKPNRALPFTDMDAYRLLKVASEAFLMVNCGVKLDTWPFKPEDLQELAQRMGIQIGMQQLKELWAQYLEEINGTGDHTLPYLYLIKQKFPDVALKSGIFTERAFPEKCIGIIRDKLTAPCLLELIWSYWHEEGMLVQSMAAIGRRFQNKRSTADRDPLINLETDPLRPLNNLLWGYIQDDMHRLSVVRRTYEYDHHYGLRLFGKAVGDFRPADSRSKFIESFHNLLNLCSKFYPQDDDTTVVADGFPILNGLKEVHLQLTEGAHNQYGDLPSTARIEMLMEQWILARPEFREFLPARSMVAYPEPWMDRVDAMKRVQGWSDASILHFRNLGVFGEQILLSIRYGNWSSVNDPQQAANWARYWRPEIQGYIHAYRVVAGVDLTAEKVDGTLPSILLRKRLLAQKAS